MISSRFIGYLFRLPDQARTVWQVIAWWETRRIFYSLIMLVVGVPSLLCFFGIDALPPRLPEESLSWNPGLSIMLFVLMANVGYTAGWIVELMLRPVLPTESSAVGPWLFKFGLGFSILTAWLPTAIDFCAWLVRALH